MDNSQFLTIGSIAALCAVLVQFIKKIPFVQELNLTREITLALGCILGVVGKMIGIEGLAELDVFSALATGAASAAASSGVFSWVHKTTGAVTATPVEANTGEAETAQTDLVLKPYVAPTNDEDTEGPTI